MDVNKSKSLGDIFLEVETISILSNMVKNIGGNDIENSNKMIYGIVG